MNQLMKLFLLFFLLFSTGNSALEAEMSYHSVNMTEGEYQEREIDLDHPKFKVIRTFSREKGWEFNFSGIFVPAKEKVDGCIYDQQGYLVQTSEGLVVIHRSFPWRSVTLRDPSGNEAVYYYHWVGDQPLISQVRSPTQPDVHYEYFVCPVDGKPVISHRKESEGRYLINEYDGISGKVVRQLAPIGGDAKPCIRNCFEYRNLVTDTYDAVGGKTSYHYDADKKIIVIEQYDGDNIARTERYFWSRVGHLTSKVTENSLGEIVKIDLFEYDGKNRLIQIKLYGAITGKESVNLTVDAQGFPTNPDNEHFSTQFIYDAEGKVVERKHNDGASALFEYDHNGKLVRNGITEDSCGNDPADAPLQHVEYDTHGNIICAEQTQVDGTTKKAQSVYDYANRKVKEEFISSEDPLKIQSYKYDFNGNKVESIDTYGNSTCYKYDHINRLVEIIYPPVLAPGTPEELEITQFKEVFTYDCLGNVIEHIDPNGDKKNFTFNIFGKPLTITYADGSKELFTYFLNGELESETTRNGFQKQYRRDETGVVTEAWLVDRAGNHELVYSKSQTANSEPIKQELTPEGMEQHQLPNIRTEEGITLNALGQSVRQFTIVSEGNSIVYLYDAMGRYDTKSTFDPFGNLWSRETYRHDGNGNCVYWTKEQENQTSAVKQIFGPCNRLVKVVEGVGTLQEATTQFIYNENGELTTLIKPNGVSLHKELSEKGILDRLYSSDGEVEYKFHYDNEGRLTEIYDLITHKIVSQGELFDHPMTFEGDHNANLEKKALLCASGSGEESCLNAFVKGDSVEHADKRGRFSVDIKACYKNLVNSLKEYFSQRSLSFTDVYDWFKKPNPYDPSDNGEVTWARWTLNHLLYWKEVSEVGIIGRGELGNKARITYINGMLNSREEVIGYLENLSEMHTGANIHYVFRESNGFFKDVLKAGLIKSGYISDHARELANLWKHMIAEMGGVYGGGIIVHYAHSLGAADTLDAATLLSADERKMLRVSTFGSPQIIPPGVFGESYNYISRWDGVSLLGPYNYIKALLLSESHVVFLKSNIGLPVMDHLITSPTYNNIMMGLSSGIVALFGPLSP